MNQNTCYTCGGDLFTERGGKLICLHCGTSKPENITGEEMTLLYGAHQKLRLADFSDAEQQFDDIVHRYPRHAQGYWGRLLSKYGIKYEDDYNGTKIPSCYAASIESVYESFDYKKALEYADPENCAIYEKHAEYIERVREEWIKQAKKQKPYDIFISYKDSDKENHIERTQDSYDMQTLYFRLKEKGYRVFFSRESLRGIAGNNYEPYIYSALSSAKVMILYGSNPDYINSTWVKNEWQRYMRRMREGEKVNGSLLVAYKDFAPIDLPSVFSSMQLFNANEWTFLSDLYKKIEEILREDTNIAKDGHVHVPAVHPGEPATCTKPGLTPTTYCVDCGQTLEPGEIIPPKGHHFGEWTVSRKATCTNPGEYERICECGERETKPIPARGAHIPNAEWEIVREPAPGKEGLRARKCALCGEHIEEIVIPALPRLHPSENLAYKVNADGRTCTVTGCGTCEDKELLIPAEINGHPVTAIGSDVGKGWSVSGFREDITSVTLPNSVAVIGEGVFKGCKNLVSVNIPSFVVSIGKAAFWGCSGLTELEIPDTVQKIEKDTFWGCSGLKNITIPDSVESIGEWAFAGCKSLTSITLPSSIESMEPYLFQDCERLTDITIPGTVASIGKEAFRGCIRLTAITLPDSVKSIGKMAFLGCTRLKDVTLSNSITAIEDRAFEGCAKIESIVLPETLRSLGGYVFCGCVNLHSIRYNGSKDQWKRMNVDHEWKNGSAIQKIDLNLPISQGLQYAINSDGKTCTVKGQGMCKDKELVIPKTIGSYLVTAIESDQSEMTGFDKDIVSIRIPDSVTSIGDYAFCGCSVITEAEIPDSVTSIGKYAFSRCEKLVSVKIPKCVTGISEGTFRSCTSLYDMNLPDSVTAIGDEAFRYCTSLTKVVIPDSVTEIGRNAFRACTRLKSLTIPNSVSSIGKSALAGIGKTEVSADHPHYASDDGHLYSKDKTVFVHCDATKKSGVFSLPDVVSVIDEGAFAHCENLMSVTLPESLKEIGGCVFFGCLNLTSVLHEGTKRSWKKIKMDKYWKENSLVREINCKNGIIKIK